MEKVLFMLAFLQRNVSYLGTKWYKISVLHVAVFSETLFKNIQVLIVAIIISRSVVQHSVVLKEA